MAGVSSIQPNVLVAQTKPQANPVQVTAGAMDSDGDYDASGPADRDGDRGSRINIKA